MTRFGETSLLCALWIFLATNQICETANASPACKDECGDFHRYCVGIKDAAFLAQAQENEEVKKYLKNKDFPAPSCDHPLYTFLCPHSCGVCTPCVDQELHDLKVQLSQQTQELATIKSQFTQFTQDHADAIAAATAANSQPETAVKLILTADSSAQIYSAKYPLSNSLDGNENSCYISKANAGGWVKYSVPDSMIRTVKVQNRPDCCGERMTGNAVYVCINDDPASCSKCGEFGVVGKKAWGTMQCNRRGRYIKIVAPNSYLQITQVDAYGFAAHGSYGELDISTHSSAEIYDNRFVFPNLLDKLDFTCYISKDNAGGWVKLSMPESYVTTIRVQNRYDCCGERMTGNIVYVCLDSTDDSCTSCGIFGSIAVKAWGEVTCNQRGSFIKIVAPNSYLQITQVYAYGEKLVQHEPETVTLEKHSSSTIYSAKYPLEASIDEVPNTCFISKAKSRGWVMYKMPESYITSVRVQNRYDCCGERMTGNTVYACFDENEASCSSCGAFGKVATNGWGELHCNVRASFIKIEAPSSYLQITQVYAIGTELKNPPTMQVPIQADSSSEIYGTQYTVEMSLDDNGATCFITKAAAGGYVKYKMPEAYVSVVRVQNRHDCCGERMTGNEVYVCLDASDDSCSKCGAFGNVPTNEWGEMQCNKRGVHIKIVAPSSYLQITQVEVHGQELSEPPPVRLPIEVDSSATIYSASWKAEYALDDNDGTGYISRANKQGWIKFKFSEAYVTIVRVQNRHNCCGNRMTGNRVFLCSDNTDAHCEVCGVFGTVATAAWGEVNCNGKGTVVKIDAPTSYLQITQVNVYGVTL